MEHIEYKKNVNVPDNPCIRRHKGGIKVVYKPGSLNCDVIYTFDIDNTLQPAEDGSTETGKTVPLSSSSPTAATDTTDKEGTKTRAVENSKDHETDNHRSGSGKPMIGQHQGRNPRSG